MVLGYWETGNHPATHTIEGRETRLRLLHFLIESREKDFRGQYD